MDTFLLNEDIITFLFFVAVFVAVGEALLITFWNKFYFPLGISIFNYSAKYNVDSFNLNKERLNKIHDDKKLVRIEFQEHATGVFMFRESSSFFNKDYRGGYTLLVRGMLYIDSENSQITVYGILNMFPILFTILLVLVAFSGSFIGSISCALLLILETSIYFIQLKRYKSISRRVALIIEETQS